MHCNILTSQVMCFWTEVTKPTSVARNSSDFEAHGTGVWKALSHGFQELTSLRSLEQRSKPPKKSLVELVNFNTFAEAGTAVAEAPRKVSRNLCLPVALRKTRGRAYMIYNDCVPPSWGIDLRHGPPGVRLEFSLFISI